ncbi:hypothetical protein [Lactococcus allomyrinae]|uniref:hypothetical protein n=1 Tax=Lactococcus allomyrinae TaxID=2419773 RepID=UPI0013C40FE0|nr:hypothetical protein [Lactococcus allomyrinae]
MSDNNSDWRFYTLASEMLYSDYVFYSEAGDLSYWKYPDATVLQKDVKEVLDKLGGNVIGQAWWKR